MSLAGWPASETSVREGCCSLVGIVLNRPAGWLRRLVARLAGEAGQGGPGPLGQGGCPPVLVDPEGGAQAGHCRPGRSGEPLYIGFSLEYLGLQQQIRRRGQERLCLADQLASLRELVAAGQELRLGQPREADQVGGGIGPDFVDQLLCLIQAALLEQDLGEPEGEAFAVSPVPMTRNASYPSRT